MRNLFAAVAIVAIAALAAIAASVATCSGDSGPPLQQRRPATSTPAEALAAPVPNTSPRPRVRAVAADAPAETPSPAGTELSADPVAISARSAPEHPGELPEDECGSGTCTLRVAVVIADTGEAVASRIRLWRLGVPQDSIWSAGDHVQRRVEISIAGTLIEGLPAGRYRAEVEASRLSSEAPPEFRVNGAAEVVLRAHLPRTRPLRVFVVDEHGVPVLKADRRTGSVFRKTERPRRPAPAWAAPRHPLELIKTNSGSGGGTSGVGRRALRDVRAVDGAFLLDDVSESELFTQSTARRTVHWNDRADVDVSFNGDEFDSGADFVGVAPRLSAVAGHVLVPGGGTAVAEGAVVMADCEAVRMSPDDPADRWRTIPVTVRVSLAGYEAIETTWTAGNPTPATIVMKPSR